VQALRQAAAAALDRGAPDSAVRYLRRALAEPPPDALRAALLAELGSAERLCRDPAAVVHLEQAWQATTEPVARARLAYQLADVLFFVGEFDRYLAVLRAGLADLSDRDPELAVRLHADRALLILTTASPPEAPEVTLE
jgi:Tetratrico peptide repeat